MLSCCSPRGQLRAAAWSDVDVFDDRAPDVLQPASDPVRAGLDTLSLSLEDALATLRPDEPYVVLHRGEFWGSGVPSVPPVPGTDQAVDVAPGSGVWSAFSPEDPPLREARVDPGRAGRAGRS